jgi:hypothetical protein
MLWSSQPVQQALQLQFKPAGRRMVPTTASATGTAQPSYPTAKFAIIAVSKSSILAPHPPSPKALFATFAALGMNWHTLLGYLPRQLRPCQVLWQTLLFSHLHFEGVLSPAGHARLAGTLKQEASVHPVRLVQTQQLLDQQSAKKASS